jgi:hypothetical protein
VGPKGMWCVCDTASNYRRQVLVCFIGQSIRCGGLSDRLAECATVSTDTPRDTVDSPPVHGLAKIFLSL